MATAREPARGYGRKAQGGKQVILATPVSSSAPLGALAQLDMSLLPPSAQDLIRLLGTADGLALLRSMPGCVLHVPNMPHDDHALAHILTSKGWGKLCHVYGGTRLKIAKCDKALDAYRNAKIVADYSPPINMHINELVIKYGLTARSIERILARETNTAAEQVRCDTHTLNLFD